MRFTFAAVFSTVLALAASQSTTGTAPVSAPAPTASYGPNYFTPPPEGYLLRAGQPYTFRWKPTTGGTVTLTLRNGANGNLNAGTVIAGNIDNSGSYTFTPPTDITPDVSYTVEIIDDQDTSLINFTQQFDITNDNPPPPSSTGTQTGSSTGTTPASTFSTISGTTSSGASSTSRASASGSSSASASASNASASASRSSSTSGSSTASGTTSASPSSTIQSTNDAAGLKVGGALIAAVLLVAAAL